jgi:outer membrane murein-binding lipoprotein Lpp
MKKIAVIVVLLGLLILPGCGNLSPQNKGGLRNRINNKNGQIDKMNSELKNLQGSINAEIGNVRSENRINAEKLDNLQQGIVAIKKDNSGIQIMQGDGVLVLILSLGMLAAGCIFIIFHYKEKSVRAEQATNILAEQVAAYNDVNLEDRVFTAARYSKAEKDVLYAMKKYQKFYKT